MVKQSRKQLLLLLVVQAYHFLMCSLVVQQVIEPYSEIGDDLTNSSIGMVRGSIVQSSSNPMHYSMTMTWTAPSSGSSKFFVYVLRMTLGLLK